MGYPLLGYLEKNDHPDKLWDRLKIGGDSVNYGYIRVSTAMQKESADTQKFGILQLANEKKITINSWVIETVTQEFIVIFLGSSIKGIH